MVLHRVAGHPGPPTRRRSAAQGSSDESLECSLCCDTAPLRRKTANCGCREAASRFRVMRGLHQPAQGPGAHGKLLRSRSLASTLRASPPLRETTDPLRVSKAGKPKLRTPRMGMVRPGRHAGVQYADGGARVGRVGRVQPSASLSRRQCRCLGRATGCASPQHRGTCLTRGSSVDRQVLDVGRLRREPSAVPCRVPGWPRNCGEPLTGVAPRRFRSGFRRDGRMRRCCCRSPCRRCSCRCR